MERLTKLKIVCEGGLDLRQEAIVNNPGAAIQLQNFEPSLKAGYRRINGFDEYSTTIVPGQGRVLGVAVFNNGVIAAREAAVAGTSAVFYGTGGTWGAAINTDVRTVTTDRYRHVVYNWTGVERIMLADGTNQAAKYDGTTWTLINAVGAPANPKYVAEFKNHMFYAGYSASPGAFTFSIPNNENDFTVASGAGEIVVGDTITGMRTFRDQLIIFGRKSIHRLTGSSLSDFAVVPITTKIGCNHPDTIQEVNGDVVYLAPDGVRTVAATERIGDFELGSISRQISSVTTDITTQHVSSVIIPNKNQYRIFYPTTSQTESSSPGIIGGLRLSLDGNLKWEWSTLLGIKPACCDNGYINNVQIVVHGGFDGFVYEQENGATFNGAAIEAIYISTEIDFDDIGLRKFLHRITTIIEREGTAAINLKPHFNHNSLEHYHPDYYILSGGTTGFVYGTGLYGTATYGSAAERVTRQPVSGSGFQITIEIFSNATTDISYAIEGFLLEVQVGGRR